MDTARRRTPQAWSRERVLFTALAARFTLVFYSNIHDYIFDVNFTDIDYTVYSDAARHVAEGRSPFARETYRYTPALAWILQPVVSYKDFGKFLFCIFDILVGWMYFEMIPPKRSKTASESAGTSSGNSESSEEVVESSDPALLHVVIFWLANPLTAIISARGNADVLVCAAVLFTLYLLRKGQWIAAAFAHGALAVHLKIYPLIYLPSIFLYLCQFSFADGLVASVKQLFSNWKGFTFAAISLGSFGVIVAFFYYIYGDLFLEEFLLYHIKRRDIKHNFSPYFYPLALVDKNVTLSKIIGFLAFLPQAYLVVYFAFKYYRDLPFCWFVSTFAFVTFNKVCTSQYFVWYIVFLPLIVDRIKMTTNEVLRLITMWFASQAVWLFFAYLYEFRGWHTLELVFVASVGFLLTNIYVLVNVLNAYTGLADSGKAKKA
ncbi:unnamed protein product [Cylicocyclus nassatus]|uniref:GPI alpha-1,4-mannosyltransferase I, catalytic subunit n=1 Tax=Cylicocyclus nassatus TaxID=53992 RepID=A0AA36H6D6_CYLNA|nr:unnamed protein product [Cylicocyclus nassatus]